MPPPKAPPLSRAAHPKEVRPRQTCFDPGAFERFGSNPAAGPRCGECPVSAPLAHASPSGEGPLTARTPAVRPWWRGLLFLPLWASRIRVRPTPDTYLETGVYEVNRGLYTNRYFGSGFPNNISQASGVYVPTEIAYEPSLGASNLLGHYKFGFGFDSTLYKSFFSALPATPGEPAAGPSHNKQFWVLADQMLVRQGNGDQDGIIALAAFAHNDPNVSAFAEQYFAGLVDRAFWHARPEDAVALFFNYNRMSGPLGEVQAEEDELGIPFSNGATGVQTHEMFIEADYNIHVYRGVDFRPEFQYVIRPNGQSNIRDAAVFGFKVHVEF